MQTKLNTDQQLWSKIIEDDEKAFRDLFDRYYHYALVTVVNVTGNQTIAKDAAQEVFFELWKKRKQLKIQSEFKSYIRRAVLNRAFNTIKSQSRFAEEEAIPDRINPTSSAQQILEGNDLQQLINRTIDALPDRCRMVFTLCRLEGMSHKEIATQMDISPKTVEHQMTKALKILKEAVGPYLSEKGLCWIILCDSILKNILMV